MSNIVVGVLCAAVLLIVIATYFNALFVAGGSGVVLIVALAYSYVVTKREVEQAPSNDEPAQA